MASGQTTVASAKRAANGFYDHDFSHLGGLPSIHERILEAANWVTRRERRRKNLTGSGEDRCWRFWTGLRDCPVPYYPGADKTSSAGVNPDDSPDPRSLELRRNAPLLGPGATRSAQRATQTVHGRGYRFVAKLDEPEAARPARRNCEAHGSSRTRATRQREQRDGGGLGIGKTSVANELMRLAREQKIQVVIGRIRRHRHPHVRLHHLLRPQPPPTPIPVPKPKSSLTPLLRSRNPDL